MFHHDIPNAHPKAALNPHDAQLSSSRDTENLTIQPSQGANQSDHDANVALGANAPVTLSAQKAYHFLQQWEAEIKKEAARNKTSDFKREHQVLKKELSDTRKELKDHYKKPDAETTVAPILMELQKLRERLIKCPYIQHCHIVALSDAQESLSAKVGARQAHKEAVTWHDFPTYTRSANRWHGSAPTEDQARKDVLLAYEKDLLNATRAALEAAKQDCEARTHRKDTVTLYYDKADVVIGIGDVPAQSYHIKRRVTCYYDAAGELLCISGDAPPLDGKTMGTKTLYAAKSPRGTPCAIGMRWVGGDRNRNTNYVIYHNASLYFNPEEHAARRSWIETQEEAREGVQSVEGLSITGVHTTVMPEASCAQHKFEDSEVSVGTEGSHTSFDLRAEIHTDGETRSAKSRLQFRPRVEGLEATDGTPYARVTGCTLATSSDQDFWGYKEGGSLKTIDADVAPNSKTAAAREQKVNSGKKEELPEGQIPFVSTVVDSTYFKYTNLNVYEFVVAGYLMRENPDSPRSYTEAALEVGRYITEARNKPIDRNILGQPVDVVRGRLEGFPDSPVTGIEAWLGKGHPLTCSAEANVETVMRRDDNFDPDGGAAPGSPSGSNLLLTALMTAAQPANTDTSQSSSKSQTSSQAQESVETLRERLQRLHREELDFYTNAPELASPALSNFFNRMRAFHGEEMIALLEHSHVADTIFSSGSDADAKCILSALDCSVVRAEIRSDMLVHFLKDHAVDGLAHRGVALRTRFFQLLRRAFRAPDETVSGLLPELWTTHPRIYRYNQSEIVRAQTQGDFFDVREEKIRQAMIRLIKLRTTWLALFHEIQCADKSETIKPLLDTMLPPLSLSLLSNRGVTVKEAALLAHQVSLCLRFDTDADAKRSDRILETILGNSEISQKYKLLVLLALKQHDPALEEQYKIKLNTTNKMKKSLRDFFGMNPSIDASDRITQESFARCVSLPPANVARSPGILKEESLSLMERIFQGDFLQDRVLLHTELETYSVSDDLLHEFSVSSQEAFRVYCDMSALSTSAKPERIEDEQKEWRALLKSSIAQHQSSWCAEAEDHIAAHLNRLQTTIDTVANEKTQTFQKQVESDVKSDWPRDMKQCRKELKRRYSSIPTSEIDRLLPLEPTKNLIRDVWCAVYNAELKQLLYEEALSHINEERLNTYLEVYGLKAQLDELDEHMDASSEARRQTNQDTQKKIHDQAYQGAQKKVKKQALKEVQSKAAERARDDAQKRAQDRIRRNAVQKRVQEASRQKSQERASEFTRQESRKLEIAANKRAEEAERRAVSNIRSESNRTQDHVMRNASANRNTFFNHNGSSEHDRLGRHINEVMWHLMRRGGR